MSAALRMLLLLAAGLLLAPVAVSAHVFPENRVRGVSDTPSGQHVETLPLSQQTATGCASCPAEIASGRALWLNRDPLGEEGGLNLYALCDGDSLGRVDTDGMDFIAVAGKSIVGGLATHLNYFYFQTSSCDLSDGPGYSASNVTSAGTPTYYQLGLQFNKSKYYVNIPGPHGEVPDYKWISYIEDGSGIYPQSPSDYYSFTVLLNDTQDDSSLDGSGVSGFWTAMSFYASTYEYAEAVYADPLVNWPDSHYNAVGNNSDTFVLWLSGYMGLGVSSDWSPSLRGNSSPEEVTSVYTIGDFHYSF